MRNLAKIVVLTGIFTLGSLVAAWGEDTDYYMRLSERAWSPFRVSSRALGLGGSYAALREGPDSTYENPAALAVVGDAETSSSLQFERIKDGPSDGQYTTITVGAAAKLSTLLPDEFPERRGIKQGVGLTYARSWGSVDGKDGWDQRSHRVNVGMGRTFNYGRVLAGMSIGLYASEMDDSGIYDMDWNDFELRLGTMLRISEVFTVGGVVAYGGGDIDRADGGTTALSQEGDTSFAEYRVGAAYQICDTMAVVGDISYQRVEREDRDGDLRQKEKHGITRLSVGSEMVIRPEVMTARVGAFWQHDDWESQNLPLSDTGPTHGESYIGMAGGLSYFRDNWHAGYDLELKDTGDHKHNFSFRLDF